MAAGGCWRPLAGDHARLWRTDKMDLIIAIFFWLLTPYQHATLSCETWQGHVQTDVSAPASELGMEMNITRSKLGCK
jgi:hypothetical protein